MVDGLIEGRMGKGIVVINNIWILLVKNFVFNWD